MAALTPRSFDVVNLVVRENELVDVCVVAKVGVLAFSRTQRYQLMIISDNPFEYKLEMLTDNMTKERVEELRRMVFDRRVQQESSVGGVSDPGRRSFSSCPVKRRVVIVTFSLPVNVKLEKASAGDLTPVCSVNPRLDPSHELIVELFNALQRAQYEILWFGWPGVVVPGVEGDSVPVTAHSAEQAIIFSELSKLNMMPVFLSVEELEHGCLEFARRTIWPIFHYLPHNVQYVEDIEWDCYVHMNKTFCDTIKAFTRSSDIFFVNDYELMLLPSMLKGAFGGVEGSMSLGFFLHSAFPDQEVFRLIPWRVDLLEGLMKCDLIGLYTHHWVKNFLIAVHHLLGKNNEMGQIMLDYHTLSVEAFNPCVDVDFFSDVDHINDESIPGIEWLAVGADKSKQNGLKYMVAVNDTSRNRCLSNTIYLFKTLLEKNPELCGKITLIYLLIDESSEDDTVFPFHRDSDFGISSDDEIRKEVSLEGNCASSAPPLPKKETITKSMFSCRPQPPPSTFSNNPLCVPIGNESSNDADELDEDIIDNICKQIGRLNGQLATLTWKPVILMHRAMSKAERRYIYAQSDIAFIPTLLTSVNMFAMEYVATRHKLKTGVLVISEISASCHHLEGCIRVDSTNEDECIKVLKKAISMSPDEQETHLVEMNAQIAKSTTSSPTSSTSKSNEPPFTSNNLMWAVDFVCKLVDQSDQNQCEKVPLFVGDSQLKVISDFNQATRRLIILSYDGTLIPFNTDPLEAKPDHELCSLLRRLSSDKKTQVLLNTGRDRGILTTWFEDCPDLDMVAEHGTWHRMAGQWQCQHSSPCNWKSDVVRLVQDLVDRTPGSVIEEKENSVAWHFRNVDPGLGAQRIREIRELLTEMTAHMKLQVFESSKVIDIKESGFQKGRSVQPWMNICDWDFILAIGNSPSDEETFKYISAYKESEVCYSIKVGNGLTQANAYVLSPLHLRSLLRDLAAHCENPADELYKHTTKTTIYPHILQYSLI